MGENSEPNVSFNPEEAFMEFFKLDKYRERLRMMQPSASTSITVDFEDICAHNMELAVALVKKPDEYFEYMNNAAMAQLQNEDPEYAEDLAKRDEGVTARVRALFDKVPLRTLSSTHMGQLVRVEGIVVRASPVRPLIVNAAFKCAVCGEITMFEQSSRYLKFPRRCKDPTCKGKSFELIEALSKCVDSQDITIQESPEELPPGQLPARLDIGVTGSDMMNVARPGDMVVVVGILRGLAVSKLRTLKLWLEANHVEALTKEPEAFELTSEDMSMIKDLAADPWIHAKILRSIAPSIYGYDEVKEAIMCLLFGGEAKALEDIKVRGELNVLIVGDPGTAKSQLLRSVVRLAPRGIYTSGRGTTAAGLTAATVKEKEGGFTLEAGAMVLADKGLAAVDEIDKMRPEDRVAIHETLEQHTVSVAKGGIVATLNARAAFLAASNPILGKYDPYKTVVENINFPPTLLSRMDLVFVLVDKPDEERDKNLARHILELHRRKASPEAAPIRSGLLRKYIAYARSNVHPELTPEAVERLFSFYLEMRKKSDESSIPITPRQLESLVRISEARAKAALRREVTAEDAEAAILLMQKSLQQVGINLEGEVDMGTLEVGKPKSMRDKLQKVLDLIVQLEREMGGMADEPSLLNELKTRHGIEAEEAKRLLALLVRQGVIFRPRDGYYKRV